VQPLIDRTLEICDKTIEKAGMKPADIDQVLLVGGQTRLPAIKAALQKPTFRTLTVTHQQNIEKVVHKAYK
jgi:molecular chaperone DnaK (HSP70)